MFAHRVRRLAKQAMDRGASAVEYGLMVAAIAAMIVGVVFAIGNMVQQAFMKTCVTMKSSVAPADKCGASVGNNPPLGQTAP